MRISPLTTCLVLGLLVLLVITFLVFQPAIGWISFDLWQFIGDHQNGLRSAEGTMSICIFGQSQDTRGLFHDQMIKGPPFSVYVSMECQSNELASVEITSCTVRTENYHKDLAPESRRINLEQRERILKYGGGELTKGIVYFGSVSFPFPHDVPIANGRKYRISIDARFEPGGKRLRFEEEFILEHSQGTTSRYESGQGA